MAEEYEIFPHRLLEDLKYDVEALKKKLTEPESATQDLIVEMEDLKTNLKELNNIFTDALNELKEEDTFKLLNSLQNQIDAVVRQNETIARGMVAISDKLEDFMKRQTLHQTAHPAMPQMSSRPMHPSMDGHNPPPPPDMPPMKKARKGIFR